MTPLQQINAMKKQIDTAQAVIAKITIPFNEINLLLEELKMEASAAGIRVTTYFSWNIYEISRIGGEAFPDPDEWVSSSANC